MNINKFCEKVAKAEKGKKQVDIAQIKEIVRIIDKKLDGCLYTLIGWRDA